MNWSTGRLKFTITIAFVFTLIGILASNDAPFVSAQRQIQQFDSPALRASKSVENNRGDTQSADTPRMRFPQGSFSENFSTDPNTNGNWQIYRQDTDSGIWTNGEFYLTRDVLMQSSLMFANYSLTEKTWEASFRFRSGGQSNGVCGDQGGDGIIFFFYTDTFVPGSGRISIPSKGYSVKLDTYTGRYPGCDFIQGEPIDYVAVKNNVDYDSWLYAVQDNRVEDNQWHTMNIWFDNGRVVVGIDGSTIIDYQIQSPDYSSTTMGFQAMTGNASNDQVIDDFSFRSATPYSISGRVTDDRNNPALGVTITSSSGPTTTTDSNGFYIIPNVSAGNYVVTPSQPSYRFAPITGTVTVPTTPIKNFIRRPLIPPAFLDLPFDYSYVSSSKGLAFVIAASGDIRGNGPGRVNSWFDHAKPLYGQPNNILTRWDGLSFYPSDNISVTNCNTTSAPGGLGITCYDYHNGIDFSEKSTDELVLSAGDGTVVTPTVSGYGEEVMIDHHNGYATFYGHLKLNSIKVKVDDPVVAQQPIAIMDCTGSGCDGPHLHFGVYYDQDGDGKWKENEVVDPYGWLPDRLSCPDPWNVLSFPLWVYKPLTAASLTSLGINVTSASGKTNVVILPNAVTVPVSLELWDVPPRVVVAQRRSTGSSFLLRVLEWISGCPTSNASVRRIAASGFAQPATITMSYGNSDVQHLSPSQLAIYHWNDTTNTWQALPSTVDVSHKQVTAQTTDTGNFDLQGPLMCPNDNREIDDNFYVAKAITPGGIAVSDLFDIAQDEDWFRLNAVAGTRYTIQTTNLAAGVDTFLQVFDLDGVTPLATDDNGGGGKASRLVWQAQQTGNYYIRVSQAQGSAYGCNASYQISVSQQQGSLLFLPFAARSAINLAINGSFEDGSYASSGSPTGWSHDAFGSGSMQTWENNTAKSGTKSVKISQSVGNDARWYQTITVQPNKNYRLSAWIKTSQVAQGAGASIGIFGTYDHTPGLFGTNDWTFVTMSVNSGNNTQLTLACRLGFWSAESSGTMWCDDIVLELLD